MRPKERRDSGQNDLFKARLDQIVDMGHPLARLGATIDWRFLEGRFGAVYSDKPGQPPLPTRLMAGLSILKHTPPGFRSEAQPLKKSGFEHPVQARQSRLGMAS